MSDQKFSPVTRTAPRGIRRKVSLILATGVGLGYSPVASGTLGTLWGIVLVWLFALAEWSLAARIAASLALCLVAIPICHDAEAVFARKDDGRIVADEYMTFPICMLGLPFHPVALVTAFLTNRFFDIVKLPPAGRLQRIPGGAGIVLDDVAAALYSLVANHLVWRGWLLITG
jgi:phosphatidylglycerophosphatase A